MKVTLAGAVWRLTLVGALCLVLLFGLVVEFGELRFQQEGTSYNADFRDVSGLESDDFVRIAGVEAGKVENVTVTGNSTVNVEFTVDPSAVLTEGTRAVIRYENLIGDRFVALEEGAGRVTRLNAGATIPKARTQPALDVDAVIGGFRPLFRALEPEQVNALTGQLIQAFQGQSHVIGSFLSQTAALTSTLADRDQLIGDVVTNLNTVLGSLSDQSRQVDQAVDSLAELTSGLADRRTDIANGLKGIDAAAASITGLLSEVRGPLKNTVRQIDRAGGIIVADHEYMDNLLKTLPDKYKLLARQGLYGDFFSFYLCDLFLKVNGKGGQPVYIKMAGQSTGRCAPK